MLRLRWAALLVLVVGLGVVFFLIDDLATRVVESDASRKLIHVRAREFLGHDIVYAGVEVQLIPPTIEVRQLRVLSADAADPPILEAELGRLSVLVAPLFERRFVVDAVTLLQPTLRLERTADGISMPFPELAGAAPDEPAPEVSREDLTRSLRLVGTRVEIEDLDAGGSSHSELAGVDISWDVADTLSSAMLVIDATQASLVDGGRPISLAGKEARATALVSSGPEGVLIDSLSIVYGGLAVTGSADLRRGGSAALAGTLTLSDAVIPVDLHARERGGTWPLRVEARARNASVEELLDALSFHENTLLGTTNIDADLNAIFFDPKPWRETLDGKLRFQIAPGRLRGVSILKATWRALDHYITRGLLDHLTISDSDSFEEELDEYDTDAIQSMSATLEVVDGVAHTQDFELVTSEYTFKMQGTIRLADLALDGRGTLHLGSKLTGALGSVLGLGLLPLDKGLIIPLPRIRGTLVDPKPEPDGGIIRSLIRGVLSPLPAAGGLLRGLRDWVEPKKK